MCTLLYVSKSVSDKIGRRLLVPEVFTFTNPICIMLLGKKGSSIGRITIHHQTHDGTSGLPPLGDPGGDRIFSVGRNLPQSIRTGPRLPVEKPPLEHLFLRCVPHRPAEPHLLLPGAGDQDRRDG